ncbi:MAG: hypothetical protein JKY98_09985 [Gammaproteobacteria bacterium]|nr:hypothetical protein [Gammaproteobacteria bacterium]
MALRFLKALTIERVALFTMAFVAAVALPLIDPDYFWHLETGEFTLFNGALPQTDPFSYTMEGRAWVAHEWLFQCILYLLHNSVGRIGVQLFTAVMTVLALNVAFSTSASSLTSRGPRLVLLSITLLLFMPFISPRPQLATYLLFATYLWVLLRAKYSGCTRWLPVLPLTMILWVNLHGGYLLGIVLVWLFLTTEIMSHWRNLGSQANRSYFRKLTLTAIATLLASAANPDFVYHWLYPFQVMGMDLANSLITEWQSPNFHLLTFKWYLLAIISFYAAQCFRQTRPDATEFLLPSFIFAAGFVALRHIPLALLTWLPFMARAIADNRWYLQLIAWYSQRSNKGKQLGDTEYILNWVVLAVIVAVLVLFKAGGSERDIEQLNEVVPAKATDFILAEGISGRMFNTYKFGGYLIHRLYPQEKVFIDGRADMYGDEFIADYAGIYFGQPGWKELFESYNIDYVICSNNAVFRQLLLEWGVFKLVYEDEDNSVLVRDIPKFRELIRRSVIDVSE